tara:strand:+ start:2502 stop:3836 length:1335 start_codon:yes stop_codon:yes gene_type:complete
MNLTYLQSSAVMISNNNTKLLCDPWLVDGELYGSWSHYPPSTFKPEEFNDVDFIYLSHIHQDHFSQKTLSQMNKDIPIVIYNFESKSLKKGIEHLGFKVIELDHNKRTKLKDDFHITILSADNCNPELCNKYFGCTPLEKKYGLTSIDTMSVIDDSDNVVVNTNDCPYDLSYQASSEIMKNFDKIDLLLVGYTSASAFPQCFTMNDDKKKKVIQEMKYSFLEKTLKYVQLFNPSYFLPFAGRYTLSGKLSTLNAFKGSSTLEEAFDYFTSSKNLDEKNRCILLNSMSSFDIESGISSKPYSRIDLIEQDEYIKNFLSKMKLDYEYDLEPTDEELEHLIPKAFQRFENKRKDIGFNSDTMILIKINNEKFLSISCNGQGYKIIKKIDNVERFVLLTLDKRLLLWLLKGPRFAYWGTAENGSHIIFERNPDIYERGLYYSLSFFYS